MNLNTKVTRTILLALALGFLIVWVLEFRRAGLFESYWLLLFSVVCLLTFQFSRLKAATEARNQENIKRTPVSKTSKPTRK